MVWPSDLQTVTSRVDFNKSLEIVILWSGLRQITSGDGFNQSLVNVTLPIGVQTISFGEFSNQSFHNVDLLGSLQAIAFSYESCFNQSLEQVRPRAFPQGAVRDAPYLLNPTDDIWETSLPSPRLVARRTSS